MTDRLAHWWDLNQWLGIAPEASAHAHEIDSMLNWVHWFMLILFVGWTTFFLYTLWRFRRRTHPKADHDGVKSSASTWLEVGVVVFEAFLLLGFAFPLWAKRVNDFPPAKEAVEVRVVAEQFAWNIHYPGPDGRFGKSTSKLVNGDNPLGLDRTDPAARDDVVTMNQLHLPVGRDAIVHITSKDVIHSFALRQMRVCQDAIPGSSIPVWFRPTVTTAEMRQKLNNEKFEYEIMCAQLCGLGHYRMRGFLTVQTQEEYDAWLADQVRQLQEAPPATEGGAYE